MTLLHTPTVTDIDPQIASRAYNGTSQVPSERGRQERENYVDSMQTLLGALEERAKTDEERERIPALFEAFRSEWVSRYSALLRKRSGLMSTFVTGASNFPRRQQEKRGNSYDKASAEFTEWEKKARGTLFNAVRPSASHVVSADSENALEVLQAKVSKAKAIQERMKAANAVIRKGLSESETIGALRELGIASVIAEELLKPDFAGRVGYPPYELTNNLANIKRLEARIVEISRTRATAERSATFEGGRIEENADLNRIQIFFEVARVDDEMYRKLRSSGFVWAPSQKAFQRQRTANAVYAVETLFGVKLA